ncbi:MAG: flagellin [Phycisphaeraceae bacterium]|nr:flagellin [Phycisphaeraceae bacterium]
MSRINTNVQSLIAQRVLGQNTGGLSRSLERLSTGFKINRGKDDPAGLIASENLRSELKSTNAAIANSERADQVVNIAEGGLQEVSGLLTELQGLITATASKAGLSASERAANQLQVDSILQTIDRISSATSFQGVKLLNGNFDYKASSVAAGVSDFRVNGAKFNGASQSVNVLVTQSAQQAGMYLSMGGTGLDLGGATSAFTLEISGALGSRELTFTSGTTMTSIAAAINTFTDITGVQATVVASGTSNGIKLNSKEFGSSQFVSVKIVNAGGLSTSGLGLYGMQTGDFNTVNTSRITDYSSTTAANGVRDLGQDVGATINGITATSNGRTARINSDFLDVQISLDTSTAQSLGSVGGTSGALQITGGGADFQLAGQVDIAGKVSIGIGDVAIRKLGKVESNTAGVFNYLSDLGSGKALNLVNGNLTDAQRAVSAASDQVASLRGRLGAFQKNTIGATIRSLGVAAENTAAAESVIRDADFASETASLTRAQILVAASTNVLALANTSPQSALQLLG